MKKLLMGMALVLAIGQMAFASVPELELQTGTGAPVTIVGSAGSVMYSNTNFGGWDISLIAGFSNSPSLLPWGLDIQNLTAACVTGNCSTLNVFLSDVGFTQTVTGFQTTYSTTNTGATASTSQTAWVGLGNTYFAQTNLIGTVGPLSGSSGGGTVVGGPAAGPGAYSLTIEDTFTAGCSSTGCVSYSSDGNITGVPEPIGVVLFGTVLAFLGSRLRRRKSA